MPLVQVAIAPLPVAWDLISRLPNDSLLDKAAASQDVLFDPPALLDVLISVDAMHAVVLLVDADVLLDTAAFEAEASIPAGLDAPTLVAVVPAAMVFHCDERDWRSASNSRLWDNCPLVDQVYTLVVIWAFALAAPGAASCEDVVWDIGRLQG